MDEQYRTFHPMIEHYTFFQLSMEHSPEKTMLEHKTNLHEFLNIEIAQNVF